MNGEIFARDFRCGIGAAVLRIAAFLSAPTKWRIGKHCDPQSVSQWKLDKQYFILFILYYGKRDGSEETENFLYETSKKLY